MYVIKRNGKREKVQFDKVLLRLEKLSYGLDTKYVDITDVAKKTLSGIYDGVKTTELDNLSAEIAAAMSTRHPDYSILASRIAVSNIHKNVEKSFSKNFDLLYKYKDPKTDKKAPLVAKDVHAIVMKNAEELDAAIIHDRDFKYDYFGIKTLEKAYLLKRNKQVSETPQQMLMRVAVGIHKKDIEAAIETYELMSKKFFTHATPTLFNAGTPRPQLSSCFLLTMQDDSIPGIYNTLGQTARISQYAGGIGVSVHNIRAKGSYIKGTGGTSNGLVPMLKNFNETARYVDQGGGKRMGSFAMYLEPWHADVFDFLELKKNHGKEEMRARDLFYALWVPDLFMKRVQANETWSLMDPNVCEGLYDSYGKEFEDLYIKYEKEGKFMRQVPAQELWFKIVESQIETGTPYMLYKDAANEKSNQKNLGTIRSSNLCAEIIEYTSPKEVAVCNLASIALPQFVSEDKKTYNHEELGRVVSVIVRNIDKIIDINFYPVKEAEYSNLRHRPMGIGVQGLADTFAMMKYPFASNEAKILNRDIFETMYYYACKTSLELAKEKGAYKTFKGSPMSKGKFQFDLWGTTPTARYNWEELRAGIKEHGIRNSLMIAIMPTASTSQILGNNESIEPMTSNIYTRRVLSGEFIVVNKHLMRDLIDAGVWNDEMKNKLIAHNGSVQNIDEVPGHIKELYRTVWEISQKDIIDMAADRGAYVCQSQSMNIHMEGASPAKVTSMHFYGWQAGLKTGMYYFRTKAARDAIKFTVKKDEAVAPASVRTPEPVPAASASAGDEDDPLVCISCGS